MFNMLSTDWRWQNYLFELRRCTCIKKLLQEIWGIWGFTETRRPGGPGKSRKKPDLRGKNVSIIEENNLLWSLGIWGFEKNSPDKIDTLVAFFERTVKWIMRFSCNGSQFSPINQDFWGSKVALSAWKWTAAYERVFDRFSFNKIKQQVTEWNENDRHTYLSIAIFYVTNKNMCVNVRPKLNSTLITATKLPNWIFSTVIVTVTD